ncbi:hypothetical protein [Myxococcus llanfairpwllgwyngyllgogerychwyrndrobwllllantysiliogogogochensis]|uniref:hypothetical protein n=1 Tax=Myxococcus llanfairpwllgwyngyllgogerychwyrndrobwllllantysiliogogogochensis TaxID=2590453 RepID=UPI001FEA0E52|nr:hypothetical protein [Myxococcus llanfairpwllgwyngyllgogerychwyrndrobwllllantysiliogogogochensis]
MSLIRSFFIPRLFALVACGLWVACGFPSAEEDARVCADVECSAGRCVSEDGAPVCRCGAWEEAAGLTCFITASRQPDDHGDAVSAATTLAPSVDFHEGVIQPPFRKLRDHDVFAMPTMAGHGFRFIVLSGTLANVDVRMLDASGKQVGSPVLPARGDAPLEFISTEAAPRFITVAAVEGEASGTYRYRLEDLGKDAHGDTLATAAPLALTGVPFPVALEFNGDEDVFTFRTEPGHGFRFSCEAERANLSLMNGAGVVQESWVPGEGPGHRVGLKTADSSTWFVRVRTSSGSLPATQCRLDDLGMDDHADEPSAATRLTAGVPATARLQGTNDVDVFSFSFTAGEIFDVRLSPPRERSVKLTDADGKTLAETTLSQILQEAASTGTYYVHVQRDSGWGTDFQVRVENLGPDDHGGTPETATRAEVGETVTGLIHKVTDLDAVTVPLEADGVYRLTCLPDCTLSMHAPVASIRLYRTAMAGVWNAHLLASGDVTFSMSSRDTPRSFTFLMERTGTDDYGDDAAHATPLPLPATVNGVFELATDVDAFSFESEAAQTYVVESRAANLRILDPNGVEVPVVLDAPTATRRFTAESSGTYGVVATSPDPFVGVARSWSFTLRMP